jgi:hypothetical protein
MDFCHGFFPVLKSGTREGLGWSGYKAEECMVKGERRGFGRGLRARWVFVEYTV